MLTHDKIQEAIIEVQENPLQLENLSQDLKENRDVVLAAVNRNGWMLQHAGENLREDVEIVTRAVSNCGIALIYADRSLKANKEVVIAAIKDDPAALRYGDDIFFNDPKLIRELLNHPQRERIWFGVRQLPNSSNAKRTLNPTAQAIARRTAPNDLVRLILVSLNLKEQCNLSMALGTRNGLFEVLKENKQRVVDTSSEKNKCVIQ